MRLWILIAGGGAAGAVLRYAISGWVQRLANGSFPLGTLFVNVTGCLLIGVLNAIFAGPYLIREEYRIALTIGFLGGFTTFSTFGWETLALASDGQGVRAIANLLLSVTLGFAATWFGYRMALRWFGV